MSLLAHYTLLIAACLVALGLPPCLAPEPAARLYRKVPRCVWSGRVLSAVALLWGARLLYLMPFEFLQPYRQWILPLTPVVILLSWLCMPELLAARAIGGLAVLIPTPLLAAVRAHPSDARLVMTLLAYALAVSGMLLLMSPYRLRDALDAALKTPQRARLSGAVTAGFGIALALLALWRY